MWRKAERTRPRWVPVHLSRTRQAGAVSREEDGALIGAERCVGDELHAVIGRPIERDIRGLSVLDVLPHQIHGKH